MSRLIHNCQWCGDTLGGDNPCGCPASREIAALRAELERKDAALKEALEFLPTEGEMRDEASLNEGRASRAGIVGAHVRAALQPKEPPCQTA